MRKKPKNKFKSLEPLSMSDMIGKELGSLDLDGSLMKSVKGERNLFLRRFSEDDLLEIMNKVGLVKHLSKKGFSKLKIITEMDESLVHYLKVYDEKVSPDRLLIDLRLSENKFIPKKHFFEKETDAVTYDMIVIEWLSAQNPQKEDFDRPQLPGQDKPGLGVLNYCFEMMYLVAREVSKDGFLDVPDHIHGAIMYSKKFKFFDPVHEGILQAIKRDLKDYTLADITWGMITETIIEQYKQEPQAYDPSEQIFYVSDRLRKYYNSSKYKSTFNKYYKRKKYFFDYEEMKRKRDIILKKKQIVDL